ncbi:MAG: deoxyribodipyrimidine photo-lyase [Planctomycetota bacterium]|jgi:deoxyribodipyrimidine photo-lyase
MIERSRVRQLNSKPVLKGTFVLYWMQASQRAEYNHALEYAVARANELGQPVVGLFALTDDYPDANERNYAFMLEGLAETQAALANRGIQLVVRRGPPDEIAAEAAAGASLVIADRGYLRHQRGWRRRLAAAAPCSVVRVETDTLVPVETASNRQEYAARTIRAKLKRNWKTYLSKPVKAAVKRDSLTMNFDSIKLTDVDGVLSSLQIDRSVKRTSHYVGGRSKAKKLLRSFIANRLRYYADRRNDPSLDIQSHMSPYLHFGQVSPLEIALEIQRARGPSRGNKDAYLEELLVRRELSINFVFFNRRYDSYLALPSWARRTLEAHRKDKRPYLYSRREFEACGTHDPYWNAAMREMIITGKMHNYMRMYWGKKIIEWTDNPRRAFRVMLELNNKYFIDGRDPASYANVGWCFGLHDRPWAQRPIFGTVRYMAASGLERKFKIDDYVRQVAMLE